MWKLALLGPPEFGFPDRDISHSLDLWKMFSILLKLSSLFSTWTITSAA